MCSFIIHLISYPYRNNFHTMELRFFFFGRLLPGVRHLSIDVSIVCNWQIKEAGW